MRWALGIFIVLIVGVYLAFLGVQRIPMNYYSKWIKGEGWNRYFQIENYRPLLLSSAPIDGANEYKEPYEQLWKVFPLTNTLIPLPVRHPLYQTFPIIEFNSKQSSPRVGISITSSGAREITRLYTIPRSFMKDYSRGQELFKLPYVRNRLLKVPVETLWKDVFSKKITSNKQSIDELIYNLYLIHVRSELIPPTAIKYGLLKDGNQVLIELVSKNKDYRLELVLTQRSGNIYSFLLRTAMNNEESKKLRDKFLNTVDFTPSDPAVGRLLYTEFKQLHFARQVDQEGIQYLYCAWSQEIGSEELLKELIFYLERGRGNTKRLQPFYQYAIKKYGKTFTTRPDMEDTDDPDVALQRKIELENAKIKSDLDRDRSRPEATPELTPDERMNLYLKKARDQQKKDDKEIIVH